VLVATAAPAWAHPGIEDPYVAAGRQTTVVLGVPSEEPSPLVGIDVYLPADFTLLRLDQTPGWRSSSAPGVLRFDGGDLPQGSYVQFTFSGIFPKKAVVALPVTTHQADGSERQWDGNPTAKSPAALLFPGYARGRAPGPSLLAQPPSGQSLLKWGGRVIVVAGALVLLWLTIARRRRRRATEAARATRRRWRRADPAASGATRPT
jgi:uncharacterized protein YcnI